MPFSKRRLILGTAQLGIPYGIANTTGQPDEQTALTLVKTAIEHGVCEFDTAQGYGKSEVVLGKIFKHLGYEKKAQVISKLDININRQSAHDIQNALAQSLKRLQVPQLHGLLLHREEHLADWETGFGEILCTCVKKGLINKIGVSVYSPKAAARAITTDGVDLIQIPSNVFDRRFEKAEIFSLASQYKKKLYIRSVFLQGLIFMKPTELPQTMLFAQDTLEKFAALTQRWAMTPQELSLAFARKAYPEAMVLFGAETPQQVTENIHFWESGISDRCIEDIRTTFNHVEEQILNPALWS